MTNVEIIANAKIKLVANGIISEDEELHTYKHWKQLGYQVFKGEKAVVSLNIWKALSRKSEEDDDEEKKPATGKMIYKKAFFFSTKQVFKLE